MTAPRLLLLALLLVVAVLPVGVVAGWVAPDWINRNLGTPLESWMLGAFVSAVALMGWMLAHCIGNSGLSRAAKNQWYALLLVGGPITAGAYLWSHLPRGASRS